MRIAVGTDSKCVLGTELNAVQLSIFSHRFMSIAGEKFLIEISSHKEQNTVCDVIVIVNTLSLSLNFYTHRADGPCPTEDLHFYQHKGAAGFLLCCVWA